jgi:starch phosphorylase
LLYDSLSNLGLLDVAREALTELGVDLERIRLLEPDAALGNGGLGRLAACFMESMSTLGIAGHGYGIRYEHGLFRQAIVDGWQQEQTEHWLDFGNPWEFERPEVVYPIGFGGSVETVTDETGKPNRSGTRRNRAGHCLRHAGGRLARGERQHAAPVACAGHGRSAPGAFQRR